MKSISLWVLSILIIAAGFWAVIELGLFSYTPGMAAEDGNARTEQASKEKQDVETDELLQKKEESFIRREKELAQKEKFLLKELARYESNVNELKQKYESTIGELQSKLKSLGEDIQARADSLKKVYEKMEPKSAAKIFEEMELDLATRMIATLKQDKAAAILASMQAKIAKDITERMIHLFPVFQSKKEDVKSNESKSHQ